MAKSKNVVTVPAPAYEIAAADAATHLLALGPQWISSDAVLPTVMGLLHSAVETEPIPDGSLNGDESEAARYALLAARLIVAFGLTLNEK